MRIAYVIVSDDMIDGVCKKILAVCSDKTTADQYVEVSDIDCSAIAAPMIESSEPTMRGCE